MRKRLSERKLPIRTFIKIKGLYKFMESKTIRAEGKSKGNYGASNFYLAFYPGKYVFLM